ncbi:hypothetical protein NIES2119_20080 [[Phormidium ambiguum] IAM M-71]|uniref:Uncharacterized protein n=2 Tax=[Phormidium ambiguum] IAM M-71 TaxID=454136 RepID=A0A1U7IF24_9CYAN|nr:hypothetical protein NIES2119_20080 [Phormidium ambiguum IAM M-71]
MQPDLQGLEITKGELKHLSGIGVDAVIRPFKPRKIFQEIFTSIIILGLLSLSCLLLILCFPNYRITLIVVHLFFAFGLLFEDFKKIFMTRHNKHFVSLIDDVERYNSVIKSIDINDQIEAAGNPGVKLKDRDRVIEALQLTREDIIRALKTEKIIRENQQFINLNPDLFANNLKALTALQVDEQASEYGRILNEALQIGMSIQDEMKHLKGEQF